MRLVGGVAEAKGISVFKERLDPYKEVRMISGTKYKWCLCNRGFGNSLGTSDPKCLGCSARDGITYLVQRVHV